MEAHSIEFLPRGALKPMHVHGEKNSHVTSTLIQFSTQQNS